VHIVLRVIRNVLFAVSLVLGLLMFAVVFRVASGVSPDEYSIGNIALASFVGGSILAVGMLLIGVRRSS
jgi:hypothetical protein